MLAANTRVARVGTIRALLVRLLTEDGGQDLVEYAFLAAFVATAGMIVLNNLGTDIANVYSSWLDPTTGVPSLWEPPAASGS